MTTPLGPSSKSESDSSAVEMAGSAERWTSFLVKQLRQRLGWSRAEMARRLGLSLEEIVGWEDLGRAPSKTCNDELWVIERNLNSHSDAIARGPVADALMNRLNLTQIHAEQIETAVAELNAPDSSSRRE